MDLAKPGLIRHHCDPNAVSTFQEFLNDYALPETKTSGEALIKKVIDEMEEKPRDLSIKMVDDVKSGKRDVFC